MNIHEILYPLVNDELVEMKNQMGSYAIVEPCDFFKEASCILIEKGRFYGMGYVNGEHHPADLEALKSTLTPYPDNDYIRGLVYQYVERHPHRKVIL